MINIENIEFFIGNKDIDKAIEFQAYLLSRIDSLQRGSESPKWSKLSNKWKNNFKKQAIKEFAQFIKEIDNTNHGS